MRYFKQEDFNKCIEFLKGKPETVETQQELYKFMHESCYMLPDWNQVTTKNMCVYSKVYFTSNNNKTANWCSTLSDGSQVVWNRKYQSFYILDEIGMNRCSYIDYRSVFTEINDIDTWLLGNWSSWRSRMTQRQLVAIWDGKYYQHFINLMK